MDTPLSEFPLWSFVLTQLKLNNPTTLLVVLESKGSSPGRQGFKMAVTEEAILGSVGGGVMEYECVEVARRELKESRQERLASLRKKVHSKHGDPSERSGMICSGSQVIGALRLTSQDTQGVEQLMKALEEEGGGVLRLTPQGLTFSPGEVMQNHYQAELAIWKYEEQVGYKHRLFIVGGGHCSLALSQVMRGLDFHITLYETRKGLNTWEENLWAHEKHCIGDYSELTTLIPSGEHHYVVIMTLGYKMDDIAFRAVVGKDFRYLGVLGSRAKMKQMFSEWRALQIPEEKLMKVHSPIGLKIGSKTPREIAISIAAQVIQVKNQVFEPLDSITSSRLAGPVPV